MKVDEESSFEAGLEPIREETDSLQVLVKREHRILNSIVQRCFSADTMLYPISAITAVCYMFVALIFVWTAIAPITFTSTRFGYWAFVFTFLPYFLAKFIGSFTAYSGKVNSEEIWIAQQVWFGYAFPAVIGIIDAVRQHFTGKGLSWGVTGEAERKNWLEYFNVAVVSGLVIGIAIRMLHLFIFIEAALVDLGAVFFAGTIVFQMWPMVSMSLYEWINNAPKEEKDKEDLKRFTVPTYVAYVFLLLVVIGIGLLAPSTFAGEEPTDT